MKKVLFIFAMMAILLSTTCCDMDSKKVLTADDLPQAAQTYIKENMPDAKVIFVKKDRDSFKIKYEVKLDNRMELEFNEDGSINDVDTDD